MKLFSKSSVENRKFLIGKTNKRYRTNFSFIGLQIFCEKSIFDEID